MILNGFQMRRPAGAFFNNYDWSANNLRMIRLLGLALYLVGALSIALGLYQLLSE